MYPDVIDRTTALCLACSSSLPPPKGAVALLGNRNLIHITNCCQRPICPSCISSNPRLARYNPCLACLAGVDLVGLGSATQPDSTGKASAPPRFGSDLNTDGLTRDQDTFILGDDDDEDETLSSMSESQRTPPPLYEEMSRDSLHRDHKESRTVEDSEVTPSFKSSSSGDQRTTSDSEASLVGTRAPYKYYLDRKDTLQGICLRFGLNGHEICKLNNLPLSAIRTTPHLLHTRAFLLIPASAKAHPSLTVSTSEEHSREEKLVRERAEKKLQTLTKEVDWRVAKAYVALANEVQEEDALSAKNKEYGMNSDDAGSTSRARSLAASAIEHYLDDEDWEAEQLRAGRGPFAMRGKPGTQKITAKWWGFK